MKYRQIHKIISTKIGNEGVGAKVKRGIGNHELKNFDPFLMLDYFMVKKPAGFEDHPHRGFITVTYMLNGSFKHEDFMGNHGTINQGDIQWMRAGKGIVHAEMPGSDDINTGLQLWINLPSKFKLSDPEYQEISAENLPKLNPQEGVNIVSIAGEGAKIYTETPIIYYDINMKPNTIYEQKIPANYNLFTFTLEGKGSFADMEKELEPHQTITFNHESNESILKIKTTTSPFRFALIGGVPINESIVQHGPFVMNTKEEIQQAIQDFYSYRNGFEKAKGFQSKIGLRRE